MAIGGWYVMCDDSKCGDPIMLLTLAGDVYFRHGDGSMPGKFWSADLEDALPFRTRVDAEEIAILAKHATSACPPGISVTRLTEDIQRAIIQRNVLPEL